MVLHTGAAEERDGDYFGPPLNRAARLLAVGHGGQILLSRATQELVCDTLPPGVVSRDLGTHRLKDLTRPEHIFQVVAPALLGEFPPLRTLDTRPHNLPAQLTPLIGRAAEIAAVCARLQRDGVRLLTLTGPGGTGKTRLGLQVAAELLDNYADGVWFVNLAPISEPTLVVNSIAQALGVQESGSQTLVAALKATLRAKRMLLLLDNFEQVVAAAPLVSELLAAAPGLSALVTSRMPLRLTGEHEFAVAPLALPDPTQQQPLERLAQYDAVRLFIERAQAVKADFAVTNENAPAVAEICYRLEGLPLAIELAAARIKLFAPQALLIRLANRLRFLIGGARDLPARQQTIRNTIAWSYHLLEEGEKTLFVRLGVFVGGCTVQAVEAVCNADRDLLMDVVDGIAALVDKSLLRQEEGMGGEPRFLMLETVREYALDQLDERGEARTLCDRHCGLFLQLAESAEPELQGSNQVMWLEQLAVEHDNLRAGLAWCRVEPDRNAEGLRLAGALGQFWGLRGYLSEGRERLAAALAQPVRADVSGVRSKALRWAGMLALLQGDLGQASIYYEESLALSRAIKDRHGIAESFGKLGTLAWYQGDYARAAALHAERLAISRELEDQRGIGDALFSLGIIASAQGDYEKAATLFQQRLAENQKLGNKLGVAACLTNLGNLALFQQQYEQAETFHRESLILYRQLGDKDGIALAILNLADVAIHQNDHGQAASLFAESLALHRDLGDQDGMASCLQGLAGVAVAQGAPKRATRLLGAVEALRESIGAVPEPEEGADYDRIRATTRAQLGDATFTAAWAEGRMMTLDAAITTALQETSAETESFR
jgi:predicted ATPase